MKIYDWLGKQRSFDNLMNRQLVPMNEHILALRIIEGLLRGYDLLGQVDDTGTGGYIEDIVRKTLTVSIEDIDRWIADFNNDSGDEEHE